MDPEQRKSVVMVGDVLNSPKTSYKVLQTLGSGSYGSVVLCRKASNNQLFAVKVMNTLHENEDRQEDEIRIVQTLQEKGSESHHIVQCMDSFQNRGYYCHEFEKLDINLLDFLISQPNQSLPLKEIRPVLAQLARALQFINVEGFAHCDLKPENIMMVDHIRQPLRIKVIDFGLACPVRDYQPGYQVQTLNYRSPEAQVGSEITEAVDMWSLGCIAAEMFLGTMFFLVTDKHDLMGQIIHVLGKPPKHVLDTGIDTRKFFFQLPRGGNDWRCKMEIHRRPHILGLTSLDDIYLNDTSDGEQMTSVAENHDRRLFVDLLKRMLDTDPLTRITPTEVLNHPFITMTHLKTYPLYHSECQEIMTQVLNIPCNEEQPSTSASFVSDDDDSTGASDGGKRSRKRGREEVWAEARKRLREEFVTAVPCRRKHTPYVWRKEGSSGDSIKRNDSEEKQPRSSTVPNRSREAADSTVATHGQRSSSKISGEEEEEKQQKRMRKDDHTLEKSHRQNESSKMRLRDDELEEQPSTSTCLPFSEATDPIVAPQSEKSSQNRLSDEETDLPQKKMKKEKDSSGQCQREDETSALIQLSGSAYTIVTTQGKKRSRKRREDDYEEASPKMMTKENDSSGKSQREAEIPRKRLREEDKTSQNSEGKEASSTQKKLRYSNGRVTEEQPSTSAVNQISGSADTMVARQGRKRLRKRTKDDDEDASQTSKKRKGSSGSQKRYHCC